MDSPKLLQRILKRINCLGISFVEPDVASASRTPKPRRNAAIPEVTDVETYESRNGGVVHKTNVVDKKNKGKATQVDSFSYNNVQSHHPPTNLDSFQSYYDLDTLNILANQAIDSDDCSMLQDLLDPDLAMVPAPPSKPLNYDAYDRSSRPVAAAVSPSVRKVKEEFLRNFKRFDIVDGFSDHHFAFLGTASKRHSKTWVKKVQQDWKILENDLPEAIFVRACESRMDLLRAVIIGAEGTPYHDGLFFFDIHFPDTYPSVPPMINYHSGGLRINPNLYDCGKVCLSLLGTWSGNSRETWIPKESTVLQLLVSIQALILNQKPYFNEPGYEESEGTLSGELRSKAYNENVFLLSLKTMVYSMRNPPKHFEEFVKSHFFVRSHDIVKACNAYRDGAPVGSRIKGGGIEKTSQSGSNSWTDVATFMKTVGSRIIGGVIEDTSQSGSYMFRTHVPIFMKPVVDEFVKVGVTELKEKPILT